jgi:hypothetical protein
MRKAEGQPDVLNQELLPRLSMLLLLLLFMLLLVLLLLLRLLLFLNQLLRRVL